MPNEKTNTDSGIFGVKKLLDGCPSQQAPVPIVETELLPLRLCATVSLQQSHMVIPLSLVIGHMAIDTYAMIDSGASTMFIDSKWARNHGILRIRKEVPQPILAINDTVVRGGTHKTVPLGVTVGPNSSSWSMEIADIPRYPVILGIEWLRRTNPDINWQGDYLKFRDCETIVQSPVVAVRDFTNAIHLSEIHVPTEYLPFAKLFKEQNDELPERTDYDHRIPLEPGSKPPFGPVYGMSQDELKSLKTYIDDMLKRGFIRKSESPAGSPVLYADKKDGGLRLCVDYRGLNNITIKNRTPLPLIDETLDRIGSAKIYTKIDLYGAYHLIRMAEGEEWKTAFRTRYGLFEYLVMPFGLTNAPATFQAMINDVLRPYLDVFVVVYLDDILIFSEREQDHVNHVTKVLEALSTLNLFIKAQKCEWSVTSTEFLGYVINPQGISMSEEKTKAIKEWPAPTSKHDIQVFMGFCNFYRRFIRNFSGMAKPLYNLTGDSKFEWTEECKTAFESIKRSFTEAPILQHFRPEMQSIVETDASNYALGAILSQRDEEGRLHPVAFFARSLSKAERNYEIYDKELLGIVEAMKHWRTQLEGSDQPVIINTDHKNLEYFTSTKVLNQPQARWSELLARYNFRIKYIAGHSNKADALSRRSDLKPVDAVEASPALLPSALFVSMASQSLPMASDLRLCYPKDALTTMDNPQGLELQERDGLVYQGTRIYIPPSQHLKRQILEAKHCHPTAGHGGTAKTLDLVTRNYYWPSMRKDVISYVSSCNVCQRTKTPKHLPYGYLQPLPTPETPWTSLSMDFIVKLPESGSADSILVVVDRLTKMSHFIPCRETTDAPELAELFLHNIFRLHGLPRDIVSDRGSAFVSKFWRNLLKRLNIDTKLSTAFHPETDGQTERVNQCLEQYLRCYVSFQQDDWIRWIPLAEFQYNNCISTSTQSSPFYSNYGFHPRLDIAPTTGSFQSIQKAKNFVKGFTKFRKVYAWNSIWQKLHIRNLQTGEGRSRPITEPIVTSTYPPGT